MQKKKEDIQARLKEIQKLLHNHNTEETQPEVTHPVKLVKKNRPPQQAQENKPIKPTKQDEPQSIKQQLKDIKTLLLATLNGQKRIEQQLSEIKRIIGSTSNYESAQVAKSGLTYQSHSNVQPATHQPAEDEQDISVLQNFRSEASKYF